MLLLSHLMADNGWMGRSLVRKLFLIKPVEQKTVQGGFCSDDKLQVRKKYSEIRHLIYFLSNYRSCLLVLTLGLGDIQSMWSGNPHFTFRLLMTAYKLYKTAMEYLLFKAQGFGTSALET